MNQKYVRSLESIIRDKDLFDWIQRQPETCEHDINRGLIEELRLRQALRTVLHRVTPKHVRDILMTPPVCVPYNSPWVVDTWDGVRAANSFKVPGDPTDDGHHDYITLLYTRYQIPCGERGEEVKAGWNREHVWPRSIGNLSTDHPGAGTDLHNLFPTDCSVNCARGSSHFRDVRTRRGAQPFFDTTPAPGYDGLLEAYQMGNAWEPPDAAKGQVARAVFYMACMYCEAGHGGRAPLRLTDHDETLQCHRRDDKGGACYLGKLSTLLAWNIAFPPLDAERKRNSTVERIQGNRNPFIDLPSLANMVDWESTPPSPGIQ